jgi:hypothetical protein
MRRTFETNLFAEIRLPRLRRREFQSAFSRHHTMSGDFCTSPHNPAIAHHELVGNAETHIVGMDRLFSARGFIQQAAMRKDFGWRAITAFSDRSW